MKEGTHSLRYSDVWRKKIATLHVALNQTGLFMETFSLMEVPLTIEAIKAAMRRVGGMERTLMTAKATMHELYAVLSTRKWEAENNKLPFEEDENAGAGI